MIIVWVLFWLNVGFLVPLLNWYADGPYTDKAEAIRYRVWEVLLIVVLGRLIVVFASNWIVYLIALLIGVTLGLFLWGRILTGCFIPIAED